MPAAKGGRNRAVDRPVAPWTSNWLNRSSMSARHAGTSARLTWLNECSPISWPAADSAAVWPGSARTREPRTKNVPRTPCRSSTSRTRAVHTASGPSSKVSAIDLSLAGMDSIRPLTSPMPGPPRAMLPGTVPAAPAGRAW